MRTIGQRAALLAGILALVAAAGGCGADAPANAGGLPIAGGRHSFDVVATLRDLRTPKTNSFTLVLDVDARRAIVGGNGRGEVVKLDTTDGRTFRAVAGFAVGGPGGSCDGFTDIEYETLEVTVSDGSLTGTASGTTAVLGYHNDVESSHFTATLVGSPDATAPSLRVFALGSLNPMHPFTVVASEPLPAGATAQLVADDGAAIDLIPEVVAGSTPLLVGFRKPEVVLRIGHGYTIVSDGMVDFAGHADTGNVPLPFGSIAEAPVVPENGFESVTDATLGGAMVMTAGALPSVAGNTSLYIGPAGAPALDAAGGRSLMVRLARQPGDTVLRFAYRAVTRVRPEAEVAAVWFGSEGASPGPSGTLPAGVLEQEMLTVAGEMVYVGVVASVALALPADAIGEVLVVIEPIDFTCLWRLRHGAGVLIDDLRLE